MRAKLSDRPDIPAVLPPPLPEGQAKGGGPERRTQSRIFFTASAEVFDLRAEVRVNGRCSDLSVGGCYVDALSTFSVGTTARIRLARDSGAFESGAVVTYAHTSMGMGLAFTKMRGEDQAVWRPWMAELSGALPPEPGVPFAPPPAPSTPVSIARETEANASLQPIVYERITLLMRKKIITENESPVLLHRMFQ